MNGVHLVNLHPASVTASTLAVTEYNRLRSLIDMENLGEPNIKPEITEIFQKRSKKWTEQFLEEDVSF